MFRDQGKYPGKDHLSHGRRDSGALGHLVDQTSAHTLLNLVRVIGWLGPGLTQELTC